MSTPTNEQRADALRERIAGLSSLPISKCMVEAWLIIADVTWLLSRIEELAKDRKALTERTVYRSGDGYELWRVVGMAGHAFVTADEALAAYRASSSGATTNG